MAWGGVDTQMRHPEVGEGTATERIGGRATRMFSLIAPNSNLPKGA